MTKGALYSVAGDTHVEDLGFWFNVYIYVYIRATNKRPRFPCFIGNFKNSRDTRFNEDLRARQRCLLSENSILYIIMLSILAP